MRFPSSISVSLWALSGFKSGELIVHAGGGTILGGTYQPHNWNSQTDIGLGERIVTRCFELEPDLMTGVGAEGVDIIRHGVGFRPARVGGARVEAEMLGGLKIVHNYGHGGSGYLASYGCAGDVAELVRTSFDMCGPKTDEQVAHPRSPT